MNIVLLVLDSLRSRSLAGPVNGRRSALTPFFERLGGETIHYRRAYATECWTLPAHLSIFTGLLPSEHGAHFQSMGYSGSAPTIAELLLSEGFRTEIITRNSIFDGSLPGVTRGFQTNSLVLSPRSTGLNPLSLMLALSKPRFRHQILTSGFFHQRQRESIRFLTTFARAMVPADREALTVVLERMKDGRRHRRPYFIFCNLYDVHAPYSPSLHSMFRSPWSLQGLDDNLRFPFVMPKLGGHRYLRPGFRISSSSRRMLLDRYHDAIELMDVKLATFYGEARSARLLEDTLLVVASDHGEAFGDHDLYLHDASVYQTHVHVPLWVHHPDRSPEVVDDVVSTRDLFGLLAAVALGHNERETILDATYRAQHPIAIAEHFHYNRLPDALPQYRQNLVAAITSGHKVIVRRDGIVHYDLTRDPHEAEPTPGPVDVFERGCRSLGLPNDATRVVLNHLRSWTDGRLVGAPR